MIKKKPFVIVPPLYVLNLEDRTETFYRRRFRSGPLLPPPPPEGGEEVRSVISVRLEILKGKKNPSNFTTNRMENT